jgi:hypothetical protein
LKLVEVCPDARALRDAILGEGRQLCVEDYHLMANLRMRQLHASRALLARVVEHQRREVCAQLHFLSK